MPESILKVQDLTRLFRVGGFRSRGQLHAIDEVSFDVAPGEIVALVGESGSGKSTIARVLAGLYPPTSGSFEFEGKAMGRREVRSIRGDMPMVFQDPFGSINPVLRVGHGLMRSLKLHRPDVKRADRFAEAVALVEKVGLTPGDEVLSSLPVPAVRRPAPASRLRPGVGLAPVADPGRRTGLDARRVDSNRTAQRHEGTAR